MRAAAGLLAAAGENRSNRSKKFFRCTNRHAPRPLSGARVGRFYATGPADQGRHHHTRYGDAALWRGAAAVPLADRPGGIYPDPGHHTLL